MKISVIVPHLSGEIYLQDCRASLEAQAARNNQSGGFELEIIIKEDDKNSPKGVAAMRNLGLEAASGDFVFFLDSDDYLSDNALAVLVKKADENPDCLWALNIKKTWYKRDSELAEGQNEDAGRSAGDTVSGRPGDKKASEQRTASESALGVLIPAKYVRGEDALRFDESLKYYSDLPFMAALLARAGELHVLNEAGALYYKRNRNDAIRYPALSQIKDKNRYAEFARACTEADKAVKAERSKIDKADESGKNTETDKTDKSIKPDEFGYAENALHEYICEFLFAKLTKGKHPEGLEWNLEQLRSASDSLMNVPEGTISQKILRRLKAGKLKSAQRLAKLQVMNRKKKGLFGSASQWRWNIYKRLFRKLPVKKNLFLFESFLGKSYGDSCRAIYEYMIRELEAVKDGGSGSVPEADWLKEKPRFVWIIDNKDAHIPGKHKEAKPLSLKYFYYVARCGAWVNNMRQPAWYEKREGVRFLETWHGTPLKKLVFDMEDVHSASPEYKMTFYKQSRIWDWLVSDNRFSTDAFESAFLFPRDKILELGYPRNDLLYGDDRDERAAAIRKKLGIPADKKIVLYAPTWRDDDYYGPGQYKFELPLDLKLMERLKDRYFFILRTHYFIADHLQLDDSQKSFVMDCSRYNDIGELYLISDVLITDYSSVFFDYANLRRPILFYVYDFEKYRDTLRGFYFDMESGCPGPLLYTSAEVAEALENIEDVEKKYADKYREFTEKFCSLDDGHAAERIVKAVFGRMR